LATIKEAVQHATIFATETLGAERVASLQLEEVESGKVGDEDAWLITLSMINERGLRSGLIDLSPLASRDSKVFTVLKKTGEVASMKIRELATT
jgi:hypothetical protein